MKNNKMNVMAAGAQFFFNCFQTIASEEMFLKDSEKETRINA
jgi:hypothetical protein